MARLIICMPTYNGSKYLRESIDSVLAQSFTDFELLIVDDCSRDATADIVSSYHDERVRFVMNECNKGLVGNWNGCLQLTEDHPSEYLQFFFQDDVMRPGNLGQKVALMDRNPNVGLCFSASNIIDAAGTVTVKRRPLKGTQVLDGREFARRSFRTHNLFGEPSNVLLRRSVVRKVGAFNERLSYTPDWEYWERVASCSDVGYVDEYLTQFRVAQESTTSSLFAKKDGRLKEDERRFVRSITQIRELGITQKDLVAHRASTALRSFAKRLYFLAR